MKDKPTIDDKTRDVLERISGLSTDIEEIREYIKLHYIFQNYPNKAGAKNALEALQKIQGALGGIYYNVESMAERIEEGIERKFSKSVSISQDDDKNNDFDDISL